MFSGVAVGLASAAPADELAGLDAGTGDVDGELDGEAGVEDGGGGVWEDPSVKQRSSITVLMKPAFIELSISQCFWRLQTGDRFVG